MRVKNLQVKSFRGIEDLSIDFPPNGSAVLIGVNGSGKSSILNCVSSLLLVFVQRMRGFDLSKEKIFHESDINKFKEGNELRCRITISHFLLSSEDDSRSDEKDSTLYAGLELSLNRIDYHARNDFSSLIPISSRLNQRLRNKEKFNLPIIVSYPIQRAFAVEVSSSTFVKENFNQLDAYEGAISEGQLNFADFFHWFKYREDLENETRVITDQYYRDPQLEAVRNAISTMIPDFRDLKIRRVPLRMTISKQGQELDIGQLSDGEKCLIAMVGDLARRLAIANPRLNNPLIGEGVVLIDEVELHLHPEWQRGIITLLNQTFSNCQFIITTHSPQVISDVKPHRIYMLEQVNNTTLVKHPEISFGRDSNRILEDVMGVSDRPKDIKDKLRELFRLIEVNNLSKARKLQQELEEIIGDDEPEFAKADVLIRRKDILGR